MLINIGIKEYKQDKRYIKYADKLKQQQDGTTADVKPLQDILHIIDTDVNSSGN